MDKLTPSNMQDIEKVKRKLKEEFSGMLSEEQADQLINGITGTVDKLTG